MSITYFNLEHCHLFLASTDVFNLKKQNIKNQKQNEQKNHHTAKQQSFAVRLLLANALSWLATSDKPLQKNLKIDIDFALKADLRLIDLPNLLDLDESQYPYHLRQLKQCSKQRSKQLVCFSHSKNYLAVLITHHTVNQIIGLGIDIEQAPVSMRVATRFYTTQETAWLNQMNQADKQTACNLLWMAKESFIKASKQDINLLQGLNIDILDFIDGKILMDFLKQHQDMTFTSNQLVLANVPYQFVFYVGKSFDKHWAVCLAFDMI